MCPDAGATVALAVALWMVAWLLLGAALLVVLGGRR